MTAQGKAYNPQLRNWSQFVQENQAQVPSPMPLAMDLKFPKRITKELVLDTSLNGRFFGTGTAYRGPDGVSNSITVTVWHGVWLAPIWCIYLLCSFETLHTDSNTCGINWRPTGDWNQ